MGSDKGVKSASAALAVMMFGMWSVLSTLYGLADHRAESVRIERVAEVVDGATDVVPAERAASGDLAIASGRLAATGVMCSPIGEGACWRAAAVATRVLDRIVYGTAGFPIGPLEAMTYVRWVVDPEAGNVRAPARGARVGGVPVSRDVLVEMVERVGASGRVPEGLARASPTRALAAGLDVPTYPGETRVVWRVLTSGKYTVVGRMRGGVLDVMDVGGVPPAESVAVVRGVVGVGEVVERVRARAGEAAPDGAFGGVGRSRLVRLGLSNAATLGGFLVLLAPVLGNVPGIRWMFGPPGGSAWRKLALRVVRVICVGVFGVGAAFLEVGMLAGTI